ncbi:MAG: ATP-grasp domain-containing protein [Clostridiales bacterium]|nr:ATP-grasp domain-containing protein [Clostridiales bacterium]
MKEFWNNLTTAWWGILIICVVCVAVWLLLSAALYRVFFKRFYDILLSGMAIIVFSPLLIILTVVGAIKMKGNPFFTQPRPGKIRKKTGEEKIFKLIKFRTMTCERDESGELLPDEKRLTKYGKFLRASSLDELPELFNIFLGHMAIVGPRPLLVQYIPLYNDEQRRRHIVRPGLTGLAQVNGRNAITWNQKFKYDCEYVRKISLFGDIKILFMTVGKVFKRSGISQEGQATMEYFTGNKKYNVLILSVGRRVELVNAFKAARDRLEVDGDVCAADMSDLAPALKFADKQFIIPRIADEEYIPKIIELCKANDISLVVPTIDTELNKLAQNKGLIEAESGARVLISDAESVRICCDKTLTAKFFAEHGFDCPVTYEIGKQDVTAFPLFIKPRDGSSSIGAYKVENKKQLAFFAEYVDNPILQECVAGKEYTADCFCDFDGNIVTVVPRWRMVTRSGEILRGKVEKNRYIIEDVKRLLNSFGFIGQITVQCFLTEDNKVKYIEINPRFGGGAPMSIAAGADSCENLYRLLRGEKLQYNEDYEDGAVYSRFDGSVRVS